MTTDSNLRAAPPDGLDCKHVIRRLWDYLDGRVPEDEREQIVAHLAWCHGCASHYQFEQEFLAAVSGLRRDDDDYADLRSRIVARLHALGLQDE